MLRHRLLSVCLALAALPAAAQEPYAVPGEETVDPYVASDANAGAAPITDPAVFAAFHGKEGVGRIVARTVELSLADPRTAEIFKPFDMVRLRRTLAEQICYVLGGPCRYTGRDMAAAHKDMGLQPSDMGALVEHLQAAMAEEGVPFAMQNRLLAKLAPMKRDMMAP